MHEQVAIMRNALAAATRLDDAFGQAVSHRSLASAYGKNGNYDQARAHLECCLLLYQRLDDRIGLTPAQVLGNIAWFHALLGNYQQARRSCEESLDRITKLNSCHFECSIRDTLGYIELHLGKITLAIAHFESALDLCRDHGNRFEEAEILIHVGDAPHAAGELPRARQAWQQALAIYDDIQHAGADKIRAKLASTED